MTISVLVADDQSMVRAGFRMLLGGQEDIEVRDDGTGAAAEGGNCQGQGLVGVLERVKIYGGEMTTGTASGGGFVLSTRLPLQGRGA